MFFDYEFDGLRKIHIKFLKYERNDRIFDHFLPGSYFLSNVVIFGRIFYCRKQSIRVKRFQTAPLNISFYGLRVATPLLTIYRT